LKTPSRHREHLIPNRWAQWWPIPLRLIVGYGFMEHGYAKLARGPESFANILHALGVPFPSFMAWATIAVELLGGLLILLGAFVTLASIPMAIVLLVAIFSVHLANGFSSIKLLSVDGAGAHFGQPGYETDLLYLAGLMALVLGGPGPLSVDRLLFRWGIDTNWPSFLRRSMGDREG
jgi:putative oxidoreductase